MSRKVCIVGAGSRYTPGILKMLVSQKKEFPIDELTLYDIEPERVKIIGEYGEILFGEYYPECKLTYGTNKEEAYRDIEFAFMQIRAGRLKMRESDEKIALKYGKVGQETCGAGGFAYGMRSVPAVVDIIKDIREYSPNAWILNYSNPAAIVAEATKRIFPEDNRIINICDMPLGIMDMYAQVLGKDVSEIEPRYFGLNHFGWFTQILDKQTGYDYLPELQKHFRTENSSVEDTPEGNEDSWQQTFNFMSKMISDYDDFTPNTYLQYYLYPEHMVDSSNPEYTRANEVMDGHEKAVFEMCEKVIKIGKIKGTEYEPKKEATDGHASYITDLANSIAHNRNDIFLVMVENHGIISNLTEGMMVEVPCRIGANGVEPLNVGNIPTFQKGLLENQYAYEKLAVDANQERSYMKALQALVLNRAVNDTDIAKAMLDDYIEANKDYWPALK